MSDHLVILLAAIASAGGIATARALRPAPRPPARIVLECPPDGIDWPAAMAQMAAERDAALDQAAALAAENEELRCEHEHDERILAELRRRIPVRAAWLDGSELRP